MTSTKKPSYVSSLIHNPIRNEVTLSYYVDDGAEDLPVLQEHVFANIGGYLQKKKASGEWIQVCKGLRSLGPTVKILEGESLKEVVRHEFKNLLRTDAKSPHPIILQVRGRTKSVDGKKTTVFLDPQSLELAKTLGNGNISEGIRKALVKSTPHPSSR